MIVRRLCLAAMLCASCAGAEEVAAVCGESDVMRWDTRGLCGVAPTGVTAHWGGEMPASETWTKESVHVVYGRVTLPTNVTLTVESGAIVKFVGGGASPPSPRVSNAMTSGSPDWANPHAKSRQRNRVSASACTLPSIT